jgi:hypothetical protein
MLIIFVLGKFEFASIIEIKYNPDLKLEISIVGVFLRYKIF